jgi:hypothetical protein
VTGNKPVESVARVRQDVMLPAVNVGDRARYSLELLAAIDWAMSPLEEARPQSVAEFRDVLRHLAPAPATATGKTTVLVTPQRAPDSVPGKPAVTTPTAFDRETLKKIEAELAIHIGPIAPMVVKSGAKKATTLARLIELVAAEISDDKHRTAFLKKFAHGEKSVPTGAPAAAATSPEITAPPRFDAATLAKAEAELAKYIGAVARVVVKRAAGKARDEPELYLLIADQIADKEERKAFVRMALSVSGRR